MVTEKFVSVEIDKHASMVAVGEPRKGWVTNVGDCREKGVGAKSGVNSSCASVVCVERWVIGVNPCPWID